MFEDRRPSGLKNKKTFATKTEYAQINFGVRCFNALTIQFHSNLFIQRCPLTTSWRFSCSFSKNYCPTLQSFSLARLSHVKLLTVDLALPLL